MTPTEQEIEFFKEAKRIQEEWEPSQGDWVISKGEHVHKRPHLVVQTGYEGGVVYLFGNMRRPRNRDTVIWLPRQGQLHEMLAQKGYTVCLTGPYMLPKNYQVILAREDDETEVEYGPTPSIALGRCLLEMLKEE